MPPTDVPVLVEELATFALLKQSARLDEEESPPFRFARVLPAKPPAYEDIYSCEYTFQ